MFSFNTQFLKVDVTATKIYNDFFLVGIGGYLHIFDKKTSRALNKVSVFEVQKIYGIIVNKANDKILLYGGRYMKLFSVNKTLTYFDEISFSIALDWVLEAKWIDDDKEIASVSMHNTLCIWNENVELITEMDCNEKCLLYSAHICYDTIYNLVILSGTVFSEILIWKPTKWGKNGCAVLKKLQKHSGVIFSVHYNETSGYICSSSDDRSAVLWEVKSKNLCLEVEQENIHINPACQVFGHSSRVFRCRVLNNCFITGGEDSFLNIWSFDGHLIRKVETHQGGPVWALDCEEDGNSILTGGGDCGVTTLPIHSELDSYQCPLVNDGIPKAVGILSTHNLVVISENGVLYYIKKRNCEEIKTHEDLRSYSLMALSSCNKTVALAGFQGQIYLYKELYGELKQISFFQAKIETRIFSLHWLSCTAFLICQTEGKMTVLYMKHDKILPITCFVLPPSKERWSTAATFVQNDKLIVGDRKGNIYLFQFGQVNAIQLIKRAHSHLGVTNFVTETKTNVVKSLGRNGVIRTFSLKEGTLRLISSEKLPFTWLVNIIDTLLLAFSGDNFIIWSCVAKRIVFQKSCGGGHRSWDFLKHVNNTTFCYIKDKIVNAVDFKLNNFVPVDVVEGYHVKEINAGQFIKILDKFLVISGGEDTTLRINIADSNNIRNLMTLKSHLSSIRTITKFILNCKPEENKETYLLFSAGGRAQIVCWKLSIFTQNGVFQNIHCSEQHSYYKHIKCEESEMRIMDLCVTDISNNLTLFCACSDGNIKVFSVNKDSERRYHLTFYTDIFYKLKCIIKLHTICLPFHNVIVSMGTDGKLVFWDVTNIFENKDVIRPFYKVQVHQSGVNSSDFKLVESNMCLLITGGDDNAIVLNLFKIFMANGVMKVEICHSIIHTYIHCAQITGIFMGEKYFVTTSIDQRVAIFEWRVQRAKIFCNYITKYNTTVADVQGLGCFESHDIDVFVYGKGIEYIKIKKKPGTRFCY